MKQSFFITICLLAFLIFSAFTNRKPDDPSDVFAAALKRLEKAKPIEKLHVSFDKPYYTAGDTIWFKAFLLTGSEHRLSALSGVVYVELLNAQDSLLYRHRLPVNAGSAAGDFELPWGMQSGAYRVRAYTEWMKNFEIEFFFDKVINIGNYVPGAVESSISYQYSKDKVNASLRFYANNIPQGGKTVAYKIRNNKGDSFLGRGVTGEDGSLEISVKGDDYKDKTSWIEATVETVKGKKTTLSYPLKWKYSEPELVFFPESGSLVQGINSRVAFKCADREGKSLNVSGIVYDDKKNEICSFESTYGGMGFFKLKPEIDKTYFAEVKHTDGYVQKLKLPDVLKVGLVLSVYPSADPDSVLLRISSDSSFYSGGGNVVHLIGNTSGKVVISTSLRVDQPILSFKIAKQLFQTGISQFTLVSESGEPLCERIAFISADDRLKVDISTDKAVYSSGEKVKLKLNSLAGLENSGKVGSFSVGVTNASLVRPNEEEESNIFSSILLSSELKGYIENPNYYFNGNPSEKQKELDLLMMTHGYRRYVWKEALTSASLESPKCPAEKKDAIISGKLTNLSNKPVAKGKITIFSYKAGLLMNTLTDAKGEFAFPPFQMTDSLKITVQGRSETNSDNVKLMLNLPSATPISFNRNSPVYNLNVNDSLKVFLNSMAMEYESLRSKGQLNRTVELKDVMVKGKKAPQKQMSYNLNGAEHADQVLMGDVQLEACPTLAICLQGRLMGVVFREGLAYSTRGNQPMLLVVNGRKITSDDQDYVEYMELGGINPSDIYSIEVLRSPVYTTVYGPDAFSGVLIINLKSGALASSRKAYGVATYYYKGFYKTREFYQPRYDNKNAQLKYTAPRSTVYWNPGVVTSAEGIAELEFITEKAGKYQVLVEGVDVEGRLGRQVIKFEVTN